MLATHVAERLARVRSQIDQVFRMLIQPSPEVLGHCETLLGVALEDFESSRPLWAVARGDQKALAEARRVRAALGRAGRLLKTAAVFHDRWRRLLATQSGGYTPHGAPVELRGQGRISLQG